MKNIKKLTQTKFHLTRNIKTNRPVRYERWNTVASTLDLYWIVKGETKNKRVEIRVIEVEYICFGWPSHCEYFSVCAFFYILSSTKEWKLKNKKFLH